MDSGVYGPNGMPLEIGTAVGLIKRRGWISDEGLGCALEASAGRILDPILANYAAQRVLKRGLKPPGPDPMDPRRATEHLLAAYIYETRLAWILERKRKCPLRARNRPSKLIWWRKNAADIACAIVRRRLRLNISNRGIQNLAAELRSQ